MKRIIFTVTNDLSYDQRMIRICTSLSLNGYRVMLVGRKLNSSLCLIEQPFLQKRIPCIFRHGIFFYAEYNFRLFFFLLTQKLNCVCAIDLDTVLACYFISVLKRVTRMYDAHELFCEMKEVITRPLIYNIWKRIEKFTVPKFKYGYTVNKAIAEEYTKMYAVKYEVIRNITVLKEILIPIKKEKFILYQGSVNEGRSFETLIPAMQYVNCKLIICGEGNFINQSRALVEKYNLNDKIVFKGKVMPEQLIDYTLNAWIGITLFENNGLNNYLSLANRFFDYMHAGVPQLCVNYPAYQEINNQYEVAVLINDLSPNSIAFNCTRLLKDETYYNTLQQNCLAARNVYNWQLEEKKLIDFYYQNL